MTTLNTVIEEEKTPDAEWEKELEQFASLEHIRWAKWQNYLHSHLTWNNDIQAWVLPHEWKDRWQMQINKPYSMLSEKEKESDREQVRPYFELMKFLITSRDTYWRERVRGMREIHRHNSIPCLIDNADEGCVICIKNQALDTLLDNLK